MLDGWQLNILWVYLVMYIIVIPIQIYNVTRGDYTVERTPLGNALSAVWLVIAAVFVWTLIVVGGS